MNASRLIPFLLVAALAATGGYLLGRNSKPAPEPQQGGEKVPVSPQTVKTPPSVSSAGIPPRLAAILGDQPLTDANATAVTFRVLEEANPVSRMAATGLILESMTPSNARAIFQAFRDVTTKTGRRHDAEWGMMLRRYGEVSGAEGLKAVAPHGQNTAFVIEGMASVNPEAATAAMAAAKLESSTATNAWLTGVCRNDPEKALAHALSGKFENVNAETLLRQAIHTSGLNGAREALQKAIDDAKDEVADDPVFRNLFNSFADTMFHRHLTNGTPNEVLSWLEQQKGQPYLSDDLITRGARETLQTGKPADTIEWVKRMSEGVTGPTPGGKGLYEAVTTNPDIMKDMDAATFGQLLPLLPQDRNLLEILATVAASVNPALASQVRAALPPAAPAPANPQ